MWDAQSGKERAKLEGHTSEVNTITFGKENHTSKARVVSSGGSTVLIWRKLEKGTEEIERKIGTGRELMSREASIKNAKVSRANKKLLLQRKAGEEDTNLEYHQKVKSVSHERNERKAYYFGLFFNKASLFKEQGIRIVSYLDEKSRKVICVNQTTQNFFKGLPALKESPVAIKITASSKEGLENPNSSWVSREESKGDVEEKASDDNETNGPPIEEYIELDNSTERSGLLQQDKGGKRNQEKESKDLEEKTSDDNEANEPPIEEYIELDNPTERSGLLQQDKGGKGNQKKECCDDCCAIM